MIVAPAPAPTAFPSPVPTAVPTAQPTQVRTNSLRIFFLSICDVSDFVKPRKLGFQIAICSSAAYKAKRWGYPDGHFVLSMQRGTFIWDCVFRVPSPSDSTVYSEASPRWNRLGLPASTCIVSREHALTQLCNSLLLLELLRNLQVLRSVMWNLKLCGIILFIPCRIMVVFFVAKVRCLYVSHWKIQINGFQILSP